MDNKMLGVIADEYRELQKLRKEHAEAYDRYLYTKIPQVATIDTEISTLAVRNAKMVVEGHLDVDTAFAKMEAERESLQAHRRKLIAAADIEPYKPLPFKCDKCGDTGKIGDELCMCYKERVRKHMIQSAKDVSNFSCNIDKDTFASFNLEYYDRTVIPKIGISPFDYMKSIVSKCVQYCRSFGADSENLFFTGEPGRGKTYMANCIANELLSSGHSVIYHTAYKLFQFLEDYKFGNIDRETYAENYRAIYDSDMLIIDDLGTEYITAYTCAVFFDVLNSRMLNNKKTLISTNLSMSDMSNKYTERVGSRIEGEFVNFRFIGDDIRVLKRKLQRNNQQS